MNELNKFSIAQNSLALTTAGHRKITQNSGRLDC